jgi:hypothetical protein
MAKQKGFLDALFGSPKPGPFANRNRKGSQSVQKGNHTYSGGRGGPLGLGHGHSSKGFPVGPRLPVSDFLGNQAIKGSGGGHRDGRLTPRWKGPK